MVLESNSLEREGGGFFFKKKEPKVENILGE
jgi:hypothetical protein